jgi:hypothetical protein
MSGKAKSLMSFPGGMPGPGEYGSMNNKVVGKGMMKYMAGEPVGMAKYKTDAQRKAAHASMAEKGASKYGKHMGPEKELVGKQKNLPEELKAKIEAAPGKYGHKKGPNKYGKHKGPAIVGSGKKADVDEADTDNVDLTAKAITNRQAKTKRKARLEKDPVKKARLEKRSERQAARQKRKEIRKSKREEIKKTRKSPAKTKKYIQDKESKIEGKAVRIIGSGSGKVLASRNKKEVGKKYKK